MRLLFFLILWGYIGVSYAQSLDVAVLGGSNLNFVNYYNPNHDQNILLSNFKPTSSLSVAYKVKSGIVLQLFSTYNRTENSVAIYGGPEFPFGKGFGKKNILFSYMQYGFSIQLPLLKKQENWECNLHTDAGLNVLMWNSFKGGEREGMEHKILGGYENYVYYSYFFQHRRNYTVFLGSGMNINRKIAHNLYLQFDLSYRFGFRPLTTMVLKCTLYQYNPQNLGIYSEGLGFSSGTALIGKIGLVYRLPSRSSQPHKPKKK